MTPELKVSRMRVDELVPYAGNAKEHGRRQVEQIADSIDQLGFNDPVGIWHDGDGNPVIVEGHGRVMAAKLLGIEEVPVITLDHLDDEGRRAYGLIHNQLTMNSGFDLDALNEELCNITTIDMSQFDFTVPDLVEEEGNKERYTARNNVPQYEVRGEEPDSFELYDDSFAEQLMDEIEECGDSIPDDVARFLELAAYRHVVFDYGKIAEFYAHADRQVQELMERSALVIIDYDDAIANGYVKLTEVLKVDLES